MSAAARFVAMAAAAMAMMMAQNVAPSSAATPSTAESSLVPDLTGCATRQAQYGFFGKLENEIKKECEDCTLVTYIAGEGAEGDPEVCADYRGWVQTATAGANKLNIPALEGVLPGAFDEVLSIC